MRATLNRIMPLGQKPVSNGIEYLSQTIGLDQKYIRDYASPLITSSYLHNVNSVAMLFKLLPLYCKNLQTKNRNKNLALIFDERVLAAKILHKLQDDKKLRIELINMKLLDFQEVENHKAILTVGGNGFFKSMTSDTLFLLEDL